MAYEMTPFGKFAKWVLVPVMAASAGYFGVAPRLLQAKEPTKKMAPMEDTGGDIPEVPAPAPKAAKPLPSVGRVTQQTTKPEPQSDEPAKVHDGKGPTMDITASDAPNGNASPEIAASLQEQPKPKKRKHRSKPKTKPPEARSEIKVSEPDPKPAEPTAPTNSEGQQ